MMTPLDLLANAIRAKSRTPGGLAAPTAILWTDHRREWDRLIPVARSQLPELLMLGDYNPDERTGPAIWLRCVVDRAIDLPDVPDDRPPIIYLPGVDRDQLRAGEECPEELRPLVELVHRGVAWHHPNGRDWSVRAFLKQRTDGVTTGPGLDIAKDSATSEALRRAIGEVAQAPLDDLRHRRLDASDVNRLAGVDVVRDMLRWLNDPKATRKQMDGQRWVAFCDEAQRQLGFEPTSPEMDVEAGRRLAEGRGRWGDVWVRFSDAPGQFPGVAEVLGRSRPGGVLPFEGRDRWPDLNDADEATLRTALVELPDLAPIEACRRVRELELEHGPRRDWVWARMDRSRFAMVLCPLARLAEATEESMGGQAPDDIAHVYSTRGWKADRAAREALALAPPESEGIINSAVHHLQEHWLRESAEAFQRAVRAHLPWSQDAGTTAVADSSTRPEGSSLRLRTVPANAPVTAAENECLFFVDGLRYELGRCLASRLQEGGLTANVLTRWAATPTVTATAKPAVTPVAGDVAGDRLGADFQPILRGSSRSATAAALRDSMRAQGYEIVSEGSLVVGPEPGARGWLEADEIDRHGHHHGRRSSQRSASEFAQSVDRELKQVAIRVRQLLATGWQSVRIVTDHGWLLLPGGLPMVPLPRHLTASKWARCAVLAAGAKPKATLWPWHWNRNEEFASPNGIACFSQQPEYAHGGLSVQECLIPDIRVRAGTGVAQTTQYGGPARTTVRSVSWRRMRCDIQVEGSTGDATADLRLGSHSGQSVASSTKAIDADGCASLILADDAHEADELVIVVTSHDGRVLAQRDTRKGQGT